MTATAIAPAASTPAAAATGIAAATRTVTAATAEAAGPIVYRPLHEAWGDADALAELRALRAQRSAAHERRLAQIEAADARARAQRRAEAEDRRRRRHDGRRQGRRGGLWGLLPA